MIKKNFLNLAGLFGEAYKESVRDRYPILAPAIAYYQLLAFAPLIGFVLFMSVQVVGLERTREETIPILRLSFPDQFIQVVKFMLVQTKDLTPIELSNLSLLAGIVLGFAAKEYFGQIKDAIEIIWNDRREKTGIVAAIKRNLEDLKITFITLLIILFFVMLRIFISHPFMGSHQEFSRLQEFIFMMGRFLFSFALFLAIAVYWFAFFPPIKITWKEALPGAILLAFLQIIIRIIMRNHMNANPSASVPESIIVVLIWFYFSNLVVIFSAEFSKVYILKKRKIEMDSLKYP
jgi:membrane protein